MRVFLCLAHGFICRSELVSRSFKRSKDREASSLLQGVVYFFGIYAVALEQGVYQ